MALPIYYPGSTLINNVLSYQTQDGWVYYFHGCHPVFSHKEDDLRSFKMYVSQLYVSGACKQVEIVKAFGVNAVSVKRWVKRYREDGPGSFYKLPAARKPPVLTDEVISQAQQMFNEGKSRSDVAESLDIKPDTLYRAVKSGKLIEPQKKT
jgi:hypothetical protein